ncbi:glycine-rich cell wall structural protein isoform X1 [Biomphalaria glabrata]|nr:glycine-rich cell wall structural protein isoform X1 [Biomphalaria glabrata]
MREDDDLQECRKMSNNKYFFCVTWNFFQVFQIKMKVFIPLTVLLVLVAPSLQQPGGYGHGGRNQGGHGHGDHGHGGNGGRGGRGQGGHGQAGAGSGYQGSSGQNVCGYIDPSCRGSPGEYDTVFAYTYDRGTKTCGKVSVYTRCSNSYGGQSNIFQNQLDCSSACENRGY